ncbi:MAG TPA: HEAT repeat domain-containing protein, partial [Pyrinomonadaceae bacterium]
ISERDEFSFLMLWNHLQESLRAESKEKLNRLARETDIDVVATRRLERGSLDERLLAINTLGWLRDDTNWKQLLAIAEDEDPVYSLSAAKALMRIDAERALPTLLPLIARREDWSIVTVAGFLREAGADLISEPLARAVLQVPPEQASRLIRFLELAHSHVSVPAVRTLIANSSDMEIITACLRVFQDAEDLAAVRKFLQDERWQVRREAANCLGRIGTEEDEIRLIDAAADEEWDVQYHAAQALANLPSIDLERLSKIAETHPNESARDIIRQVMAESRLAEI